MKFLTKSVVASIVIILLFSVGVIILTCRDYCIPDVLIERFFQFFGTEIGACAFIQITKKISSIGKIQDKIQLLKAENLPIEKSDITETEESEDAVYYG